MGSPQRKDNFGIPITVPSMGVFPPSGLDSVPMHASQRGLTVRSPGSVEVVMSQTHGPIVPRRRLAAELKRLREASNRTLDQVASDLLISTSKLSRLENAQGSPQARRCP